MNPIKVIRKKMRKKQGFWIHSVSIIWLGKKFSHRLIEIFDIKLILSAEIDAAKVNASGSNILDYASSSDSDIEPTTVSDTLRGTFLDDSDTESVNSPQEDPLKYVEYHKIKSGNNCQWFF